MSQPLLVLRLQFTPRVGGGSALVVRHLDALWKSTQQWSHRLDGIGERVCRRFSCYSQSYLLHTALGAHGIIIAAGLAWLGFWFVGCCRLLGRSWLFRFLGGDEREYDERDA